MHLKYEFPDWITIYIIYFFTYKIFNFSILYKTEACKNLRLTDHSYMQLYMLYSRKIIYQISNYNIFHRYTRR